MDSLRSYTTTSEPEASIAGDGRKMLNGDSSCGWDNYRKADVKAKYIGDFRQWRDPSKYSQALDRLIRDLQTPAETNAAG